jgi:hypothetical protein
MTMFAEGRIRRGGLVLLLAPFQFFSVLASQLFSFAFPSPFVEIKEIRRL